MISSREARDGRDGLPSFLPASAPTSADPLLSDRLLLRARPASEPADGELGVAMKLRFASAVTRSSGGSCAFAAFFTNLTKANWQHQASSDVSEDAQSELTARKPTHLDSDSGELLGWESSKSQTGSAFRFDQIE